MGYVIHQLVLASVALWSVCHGYYGYQTKLPNGQNVPHPCKVNYLWRGVGHLNPLGGGERNAFGKDFARMGHKWSVELCRLDSDGDGLTNGQELGDPTCVWEEGSLPQRTDNITHPGVCDPWGSQKCASLNSWVSCDVGEFKCDAINEPDVQNITVRFPSTKVPAAETTYYCYVFDVPSDQPYHLIATKPYIDNPNVMHHIAVMACEANAPLIDKPGACNMGTLGCTSIIGIWTVGMTGDCIHPQAGFRFGKGSSSRIALQFHWTNKHHVDDWYDSSGMTLYYTPRLRPNDAGVITVGQNFLDIPPGRDSVEASGSCSSACTKRYQTGEVKVFSAINHMHYLGVRGNIQLLRDDHVISNVTYEDPFSYDNPQVYRFDTPFVVKPGDELRMNCWYSSLSRDTTTMSGDGTFNEMCYGVIIYYPAEKLSRLRNCIQWKDMDFCDIMNGQGECSPSSMFSSSRSSMAEMVEQILSKCRTYGSCQEECAPAIAKLRQTETCLNGTVWDYIRYTIMMRLNDAKLLKFVRAIDICDHESQQAQTTPVPPQTTPQFPQTTPTPQGCKEAQAPGKETLNPSTSSSLGIFMDLIKALGNRPLLQNIIFNAKGP